MKLRFRNHLNIIDVTGSMNGILPSGKELWIFGEVGGVYYHPIHEATIFSGENNWVQKEF